MSTALSNTTADKTLIFSLKSRENFSEDKTRSPINYRYNQLQLSYFYPHFLRPSFSLFWTHLELSY
jgi:hypothetical protein